MRTSILKKWRSKECEEHGAPSRPGWGLGFSSQDVIDPDIDLSIDFIGFISLAPIQIERRVVDPVNNWSANEKKFNSKMSNSDHRTPSAKKLDSVSPDLLLVTGYSHLK
ncbi:hypothetical protein Y032_0007g3503 [Ancylostoma ceylanicum]|uniref:Uncharacterized protein n=1 Tax=Ancylostoma ceylanicum TaxID=53326 RepID=A0A016VNM4_9BILA|nr:hypothetical protein Y032_0007g3503 [Ancylostoma ceylanicum]